MRDLVVSFHDADPKDQTQVFESYPCLLSGALFSNQNLRGHPPRRQGEAHRRRGGEPSRQPGLQNTAWVFTAWFHGATHPGEFGRLQDCPCTARAEVCRALGHSPLSKRCLALNVGALANNSNGKLKDIFGFVTRVCVCVCLCFGG